MILLIKRIALKRFIQKMKKKNMIQKMKKIKKMKDTSTKVR